MKLAAFAAAGLAAPLRGQTAEELFKRNIGTPDQFNKQFPPHKVIDNIYYVGSESLASFLFVTPAGNILLNSCFEATVPVIRSSVEQLGFKFTDVKILLGSHAHGDHMDGDARVKELTGITREGNAFVIGAMPSPFARKVPSANSTSSGFFSHRIAARCLSWRSTSCARNCTMQRAPGYTAATCREPPILSFRREKKQFS